MEIKIGKWKIRSWKDADVAAIVKYANNRKVWINLRDSFPHPYTEKYAIEWINHVKALNPQTQFAIASDEEAVGGIGFLLQNDVYRRSAEIGYWLGETHWEKGIATKAVRALTEYVFAHYDIVRIYASVFEWNRASARVLEKAGYTYEGRLRKCVTKDGKTIDQLMYAIVLE